MQSRTGSVTEAVTNTVVGWSLNFGANLTVLPLFGFGVTISQAFGIGVIFTVISLIRSYVLRRIFDSHEGFNSHFFAGRVRNPRPSDQGRLLETLRRHGRPLC